MSQVATAGPDIKATPNDGAPAAALTKEQIKAHDREVFRRLQATADGGTAADEPKALPVVKPASSPAHGVSRPASSDPAAAPSGAQSTDADRREMETIADAVLTRDGIPEAARKRILAGADPKEIQEIIDKRRKVQGDVDRLGSKAADLERQLKAGTTQNGTAKGAADPAVDDFSDLSPKQRAMAKKFTDEGDAERTKEYVDSIRESRDDSRNGQSQGRRSDPVEAEAAEAANMATILVRLRAPLDQIAGDYPELKNDSARRELVKRADSLVRAGVFDRSDGTKVPIEQVFAEAARVQYGSPSTQTAQRRLIDQNRKERNGQPDPTESRGSSPAVLVGKDREREAFRLLSSGKTPEEVKALLDKPTVR